MTNKYNDKNQLTPRENFLVNLLQWVTKEYRALIEKTHPSKTLKIVEISKLSSIPGESEFVVQLAAKNFTLNLTAAKIISDGYNLKDFPDYHAEIIRQAAQGKLIPFLKLSDKFSKYKILSKHFDNELQQYIFTIGTQGQLRFMRTAEELSVDKEILSDLALTDIYDVGFTQGTETILKEKTAFLLAKKQ